MEKKRLHLSKDDKKLAGVAGGLAEYFETDSSLIRLGIILLALITAVAPVVITYIIAWLVIPKKS